MKAPEPDTSGRSLQDALPLLKPEWDEEHNHGLDIESDATDLSKPYWWRCANGHRWKESLEDRINTDSTCPVCGQRKRFSPARRSPSIAELHPELMQEWDYKANFDVDPHQLRPSQNKTYHWICQHGHRWTATLGTRLHGKRKRYCPTCASIQAAAYQLASAAETKAQGAGNLVNVDLGREALDLVQRIRKDTARLESIIKNLALSKN